MIYLDNASTTVIDSEVATAYQELLNRYYANAASHHPLGSIVDSLQTRSRQQIASYFQAKPEEIIFTSGASEANNLAIKGTAFQYAHRGKHIITSAIEHPSVLNACKQLQEFFGFEITYLDVNEEGKVLPSSLQNNLRKDTILVSIMSVNNEVGSCNDIPALAAMVKQNSTAFFHSDMTQAIGKIPIDATHVDLVSCSAHKIHGLKGSGLLLKRKPVELMPLISGGGHEFGYRSGTSNWPVNVVLAKTLRLAFDRQPAHYLLISELNQYARTLLSTIEQVQINSPIDGSPYILNVSIPQRKISVLVQALEDEGICVSTLSACSSKIDKPSSTVFAMFHDLPRALSTIRISFSSDNTKKDIDVMVTTLKSALSRLK